MVFAALVWNSLIYFPMKKLAFLLSFTLILFSSCQLQKVMVNVYTPAKLTFPPEIRSMLVTSRYVPATGPYEDVQWGAYESVDSLKWLCSESIVDTLAKRMVEKNTYLVKVRHFPRMLRNNDSQLPDPLPWDGLSALTKKEYVQTVLIIEGFDISKTPVDISGSEGNFLAQFTVNLTVALRIYEPEKMRMLDDSLYTFKTEFKTTGKTREEAASQLPEERKALITACSNAAENYFLMIKPGQVEVKRYYYPKGDSSLIKADLAVREGKWGRAETKWKWLAYNDADSIIQGKASFNMALSCERDGRLNQAIGFARRSQRLNPSKKAEDYINLLNKKILDFEEQVRQQKIIKKW